MRAPRRFALPAALLATAAAVVVPAATPAGASDVRPDVPRGVHEIAATASSFTVTSQRAAHARKYVLIASRVKSDIFYQNLGRPSKHRRIAASSHPTISLHGLSYTTRPYYFRVQTRNGDRQNLSNIHFGYVAPAVPALVRAVNPVGGAGLALSWANQRSNGFQIEQATNAAMTAHRKTYRVDGNVTQFTPPSLRAHGTYYFRVRSQNSAAHSAWSPAVPGVFTGTTTPVKLMTWNVLHHKFDGTKENGNRIAPWSKRLPVVISMIKKADPDIISINEANDAMNPPLTNSRRCQINTIYDKLKRTYGLADADFSEDKYHPQVGDYILYRRSMFRALYQQHGKAHFFKTNHRNSDNAVTYQALQDIQTGAKFIVVSLHFPAGPNNKANDKVRKASAASMLRQMAKLQSRNANYRGLPVIYAGDTNSFAGHNPDNYDSPGALFNNVHATDSLMAAQSRSNTKYGSVNGYTRVPSHTGRIIDHFYATAGVAVHWWKQDMHLVHGHWPGVIPSDHNPILAGVSIQS
jgi:exonuclease III